MIVCDTLSARVNGHYAERQVLRIGALFGIRSLRMSEMRASSNSLTQPPDSYAIIRPLSAPQLSRLMSFPERKRWVKLSGFEVI